jgi:hypothetical protein
MFSSFKIFKRILETKDNEPNPIEINHYYILRPPKF